MRAEISRRKKAKRWSGRRVEWFESLESRLPMHAGPHDEDPGDQVIEAVDLDNVIPADLLQDLEEAFAATGTVSASPFEANFTFTTRASDGMPILNSLPSAPADIFIDFNGGTYHGSTVIDAYDVDGNPANFNATEQSTIAEAWRQMSMYFAMFNVNVTTIGPETGQTPPKPTAWLNLANNISGGQSYVNVFPNSRGESRNASGDARTRVSGMAHEIGHNFGNQHTSYYDTWGTKTSEYRTAPDPLHGPLMGVDYSGIIHKWTTWHRANSTTGIQDDIAVIAGDLDNFGGDGFRADDFGGTIAAATKLITSGPTQAIVGIIERLADVDMFSFDSLGGYYNIMVGRENPSGVDVRVSIFDAIGNLMASEDGDPRQVPYTMVNDTHLTMPLAAGKYYVKVESHLNYGDVGQYIVRVDPMATGWMSEDVGLPAVPGYANFDATTGNFVVAGSGADISSTSDNFGFSYQTLSGDGSITAQLISQENTNSSAKTGVMIRESLAPGSRYAMLAVTPSGSASFLRRTSDNGSTSTTSVTGAAWIRLTRTGNTITVFTSPDNVTWTQRSSTTVTMGSNVLIGLATTARNNAKLSAATFSNVAVTGTVNPTPTLSARLVSPKNVAVTSTTNNGASLSWNKSGFLGDTNVDNVIDIIDFNNVMNTFGGTGAGDTNGDGAVDIVDFNNVMNNFGVAEGPSGYVVERSADGITYSQIGTTAADVTTFTDSGLADFQRYFYRVRAQEAAGVSQPSTAANGVTKGGAVSGMRVVSLTTSRLVIDWNDASGETNYRVERSLNGTSGWTTLSTKGRNVPSHDDNSGLSTNTTYFYRVSSLDNAGAVTASNIVSGTTRLPNLTGLAFTNVAANTISIAWNAVTGAANYRVERSLDNTTFTTLASSATGTTFTDATVSPGTQYFYRVTARNPNTQSAVPTAISTTTPAAAAAFAGLSPNSADAVASVAARSRIAATTPSIPSLVTKPALDPFASRDAVLRAMYESTIADRNSRTISSQTAAASSRRTATLDASSLSDEALAAYFDEDRA